MKNFLSEKNIAGVLFIMVMVAFSFAHEDSKKRNNQYNLTSFPVSESRPSTSASGLPTSAIHILNGEMAEIFSVK